VLLRGSSSTELCFVSGCIAIALRCGMRHSYRLVLDFRPLCDNLLGALTQLGLLACYTTSFVMRLAASKFVVPATLKRFPSDLNRRDSQRVKYEPVFVH
jgi:hypothetical protein